MAYFVLIAGVLAIIFLWVSFTQGASTRAEVEAIALEQGGPYARNAARQAHNKTLVGTVIGTMFALAAMWFWGAQALIAERQEAAIESQWLDTFVDRHRQSFERDCQDILSRMSAVTGIVYDRDSGRATSILTCQQSWSYPDIPSEFSESKYDQPERTPPFASTAIFGEDTSAIMCTDIADEGTCYSWDDFAAPQ